MNHFRFSFGTLALTILQLTNHSAFAQQSSQIPGNLKCSAGETEAGDFLNFNNEQVLIWKATTKDQYLDRGMVQGRVTKVYTSRATQDRFSIDLNGDANGDLEVIYNNNFGALPKITPGMNIIACGDYITVKPGARLPSPDGGIIHWVHYNPGNRDGGRHSNGFLIINGKVFGFQKPND